MGILDEVERMDDKDIKELLVELIRGNEKMQETLDKVLAELKALRTENASRAGLISKEE